MVLFVPTGIRLTTVVVRHAYWLPATNGHLPSTNKGQTGTPRANSTYEPLTNTSAEAKSVCEASRVRKLTKTGYGVFRRNLQIWPSHPPIVTLVGNGASPPEKVIKNWINGNRYPDRCKVFGTYIAKMVMHSLWRAQWITGLRIWSAFWIEFEFRWIFVLAVRLTWQVYWSIQKHHSLLYATVKVLLSNQSNQINLSWVAINHQIVRLDELGQ